MLNNDHYIASLFFILLKRLLIKNKFFVIEKSYFDILMLTAN